MDTAANQSTVMSPTGAESTNPLLPPSLSNSTDKLTWRKNVRYWAKSIAAFARGGDSRSKGALSALAMTLFRSLPAAKQQLVEKHISTGEITICPDDVSLAGQMRQVEKIMLVVARDSASDRIHRLAALSRKAHSCIRNDGETLKSFIERFCTPAASYLNMTQADESSAESQNFAVAMISNAKLPSQVYTTVMANLVGQVRNNSDGNAPTATIQRTRLLKVISCLQNMAKIVSEIEEAVAIDASHSTSVPDESRPAGHRLMQSLLSNLESYKLSAAEAESTSSVLQLSAAASVAADSEEESYPSISLADAVLALENVNLLPEDVKKPPVVPALLAHTELANRFNSNGRGGGRGGGGWRGSSRRGGMRSGKREWKKKSWEKEDGSASDREACPEDVHREDRDKSGDAPRDRKKHKKSRGSNDEAQRSYF